jgi:hypothetical protein
MSAFMLSKWVIRRLYQIRHHFLWQGHKTMQKSNRAIRLVSCRIVARSKALGDLEVRDLEQMNKLLMLKWMWQWVGDEPDWWKEVTLTPGQHIRPWKMTHASPFWKSIALLELIFHVSVWFQIGQGAKL